MINRKMLDNKKDNLIDAYQKIIDKAKKYESLEKIAEFQEFIEDVKVMIEQHSNILDNPIGISVNNTPEMDYARLKASQYKKDAYLSIINVVEHYRQEAKRAVFAIEKIQKENKSK